VSSDDFAIVSRRVLWSMAGVLAPFMSRPWNKAYSIQSNFDIETEETGESVTPGRIRKRKRWDSQRASHLASSLWTRSVRESSALWCGLTKSMRMAGHGSCGDRRGTKVQLTTQHPHKCLHSQRRVSFRPIVDQDIRAPTQGDTSNGSRGYAEQWWEVLLCRGHKRGWHAANPRLVLQRSLEGTLGLWLNSAFYSVNLSLSPTFPGKRALGVLPLVDLALSALICPGWGTEAD